MQGELWWTVWAHDWGRFLLAASDGGLVYLGLPNEEPTAFERWADRKAPGWRRRLAPPPALAFFGSQLDEYLAGVRRAFTLPLDLLGSEFERRVWNWVGAIGYGCVRSYGEGARAVGNPRAVRALAQAVARNPVAVVVPCHRVVGAGGHLVGYAGGLALKARLLALEGWTVVDHRLRAGSPSETPA